MAAGSLRDLAPCNCVSLPSRHSFKKKWSLNLMNFSRFTYFEFLYVNIKKSLSALWWC